MYYLHTIWRTLLKYGDYIYFYQSSDYTTDSHIYTYICGWHAHMYNTIYYNIISLDHNIIRIMHIYINYIISSSTTIRYMCIVAFRTHIWQSRYIYAIMYDLIKQLRCMTLLSSVRTSYVVANIIQQYVSSSARVHNYIVILATLPMPR